MLSLCTVPCSENEAPEVRAATLVELRAWRCSRDERDIPRSKMVEHVRKFGPAAFRAGLFFLDQADAPGAG